MTRMVTRLVLALTTAGGAVIVAAAPATAVEVPPNGEVRYVFCSSARTGNEITYRDELGERKKVVSLDEQQDDGLWCGNVDVRFKRDAITGSSITHEDPGYVYAAVYVNGVLEARSEDRTDLISPWAHAF